MDRRLLKPLLLITVVLIMPLVLLATRGESFAAYVDAWRTNPPPRATLAALVVAVLASDIVLPVPSGPVSTLAGSQLGVLLGTLTSTVGMTLGAAMAFALARGVRGFSRGSTIASANFLDENAPSEGSSSTPDQSPTPLRLGDHGHWLLVVTRPLPVIAEAAVLLVGGLQMSWRAFLPTVVAANLAISVCYALLGKFALEHGWLPLAVCATIALPLAAAVIYARPR
jgi:3-dehydroquinate synthase